MDKLKTRVLFISLIILALVSISAVAAADSDDIINANQDDFDLSEETVSDVEDTQEPILADDEPEPTNPDGSSYVTIKFVYMNESTNGETVEYIYKQNQRIASGKNISVAYSTTFSRLVPVSTQFEHDGSKYVFKNWTSSITGDYVPRYQNQYVLANGSNFTVIYNAEFNVYKNTVLTVNWEMKDSNGEDKTVVKTYDLKHPFSITLFAANFTNMENAYKEYDYDGTHYVFDHWEDGEGNTVDGTVKHEYPYNGEDQTVTFKAIYKAEGNPSKVTVKLVGLKDVNGNDHTCELTNTLDPGTGWNIGYAMFADDIADCKSYDLDGIHHTFDYIIGPDDDDSTDHKIDPDNFKYSLKCTGEDYEVVYTAVYKEEVIGNFTLNYNDAIAHGTGSWSSIENYGVNFTHTFRVPADVPSGAVFLYWEREDDPSIKYYPDSDDQYQFRIDYVDFAGKDVKVVVNAVYDIKTSIELEEITGYVEDVVDITAKITSCVSDVPDPISGTATLVIDYTEKLSNGLLGASTYTQTVEVVDGQAVFKDVPLENPGTYKYTVTFNGYNYNKPSEGIRDYLESEADSKVNILPLDTTTTADDVSGTVGDKVDITADIVDQNGHKVQNGTAVLKINGKEYKTKVNDGKAVFKGVELPDESTEATIEYLGNDYYNPSNTTIQITVTQPEEPEEPTDEPADEPEEEPSTPTAEKAVPVVPAAGNPIALVVLALLTLVSTVSLGRKK